MPAPKVKKKPSAPPPRAVAVLEWVPTKPAAPGGGPIAPDKEDPPKQARLIPISIYYQGGYQDASVFLSQPTPLALQADNVYELEKSGDPAGTFTLHTAARVKESWVAYGDFKPVPPPKPFTPNTNIALGPSNTDEEEGDRPVLKRRHPDATSAPSSGTPDTSSKPATAPAPAPAPIGSDDPDRPTLKRHDTPAPAPATQAPADSDDPVRPTLHARPVGSITPATANDPKTSDNYLNPADDPSRPRIRKGSYREQNPIVPSVLGNPPDMRQTIAVSDSARTGDHPFAHAWNDEAERKRAEQAMQQLAFTQIAAYQKTQAAPTHAAVPAPKSATHPLAHSSRRKASLADIDFTAAQFAAYDLSYQDEPTYVFAAQSTATGVQQIFVAIVARPDIYGTLQVEFSAVTTGGELGLTPRYRLVDAVDANGDGRAELLLQADNEDGRRFVLLDVYRGQATKVFETALLP